MNTRTPGVLAPGSRNARISFWGSDGSNTEGLVEAWVDPASGVTNLPGGTAGNVVWVEELPVADQTRSVLSRDRVQMLGTSVGGGTEVTATMWLASGPPPLPGSKKEKPGRERWEGCLVSNQSCAVARHQPSACGTETWHSPLLAGRPIRLLSTRSRDPSGRAITMQWMSCTWTKASTSRGMFWISYSVHQS